jgi:hypothetical protein
MSCPLRRPQGSGYQKPADSTLAAVNEKALADLMAARRAQEARWSWNQAAPVEPKPPAPRADAGAGSTSTTTTAAHGSKEGAAS